MAKYCVFVSEPRYGNRDEIVGESHHRVGCFKQLRAAKKVAKAQHRLADRYGDLLVTLCRGVAFCGHARQIWRKPAKPKRVTRATRRERLQPGYLPF